MKLVQFENNDFIIAFKPHNLPTVPLKNENTDTLLNQVALLYPEILNVTGKNPWEGGALHRLDNATSGLVVFARNQIFYDYMQAIQKKDLFKKYYRAVTEPADRIIDTEFSSYFRAFGPKGKTVKVLETPERADTAKLYTTALKTREINTSNAVFECIITQGFRHQIRSHLAYIGYPIKGDVLYNPNAKKEDLSLECTGLEFPLMNGEYFTYTLR